jgi:predicted amidohydrolase
VIAANQRRPPAGLTAYGRSMIVDPRGTVLVQAPTGRGDRRECDTMRSSARSQVPSLAHRRPESYGVPT